MEFIRKLIYVLNAIGLKTIIRTIRYSLYRDRVDKRFYKKNMYVEGAGVEPGEWKQITPTAQGAAIEFQQDIKLEIHFLTPNMVRLTWQPGELPVPYAVVEQDWPKVAVRIQEGEETFTVSSDTMAIVVHRDGVVEYVEDGAVFRVDQPPQYQQPIWFHRNSLHEEAGVYGLGERTRFNLNPGVYSLWNSEQDGHYGVDADPLYMTIPVYYCRQPELGGYLAFYENSFEGQVTFGEETAVRFQGGALRLYIIRGGVEEAVESYTRLTGRAPMPPRWALGYHQSRWGYKDEADIRGVVEGFQKHALPLQVIHLDLDYMNGNRVFTFNEENFPNFRGMVKDLDEVGVKTVAVLDPGVKQEAEYDVYIEGQKEDVYCKLPNGEEMKGLVWPGWVSFPDFTNPKTRVWWGSYYPRLLEAGITGVWNDMNEPANFSALGEKTCPRATQHDFEGRGGGHDEGHNLYGLLMVKAGYEAMRKFRPEKRPWLLTRSGWAGVQRYAWKWSGDVKTSWDTLRVTIKTLLGYGFSGIPFSGSDIGGFTGDVSPELFLRWFQFSTFVGFYRVHSSLTTPRREPWEFGEPTLSICRDFLELRQQIMPYLYSLAWEASQSGAPIVRPLFWGNEEDEKLWVVEDAFMVGDALMVAPVIEPGTKIREVYLPRGKWYNFWSGEEYIGGETIRAAVSLETIPVFVRGGSVLALEKKGMLNLDVYVHQKDAEPATSLLYSDTGDGYAEGRVDRFEMRWEGNDLVLRWKKEGVYPLPNEVKVKVYGVKVGEFVVDGKLMESPSQPLKPFRELRIANI